MSTPGLELTEEQIAARHRAAHDLTSPVRALSILADLLAEELEAAEPNLDAVRTLSAQLVSSAGTATDKLRSFANDREA